MDSAKVTARSPLFSVAFSSSLSLRVRSIMTIDCCGQRELPLDTEVECAAVESLTFRPQSNGSVTWHVVDALEF